MATDAEHLGSGPDGSPSLAEILDVVRPHVEKIEEGFTAIRLTLDALSQHVGTSRPPTKPSTPQEAPVAAPDAMPPAATPVTPVAQPSPAQTPVAELPPRVEPQPQPKAVGERPGRIATSGGDGGNWSQILFGDGLAGTGAITHLSGTLLSDVQARDNAAISLAGQVMTFRTAIGEQKPRMLKDLGEAFYRWKPHGDTELIEALITWIHAELDAAELGNRITLVQVGDRYDMQRHNAKQAGVEVAEVYGWVILRDNGKVYSKATVAVR